MYIQSVEFAPTSSSSFVNFQWGIVGSQSDVPLQTPALNFYSAHISLFKTTSSHQYTFYTHILCRNVLQAEFCGSGLRMIVQPPLLVKDMKWGRAFS